MPKKGDSEYSDIVELYPRASSQLEPGEMVPIETEDEAKWSWNPVDWFHGIKNEIQHFNLTMTPRRRVVRLVNCS